MTRRTLTGLGIASCALLAALPAALPQQPPASSALPRTVVPPAAQAQLKDVLDKARSRYGKGTPNYYRDATRGLQTILGQPSTAAPAPSAPVAGQRTVAPGIPPAAGPTLPPAAMQHLFSDRTLRQRYELAIKRVQTGEFSAVDERLITSIPAAALEAAPASLVPLRDPAEVTATSRARAAGVAPAALTAPRPLAAGLKDKVVGLEGLPETPQAEPSVSADPADPYPETVALSIGGTAADPRRSLCSGVLIARSKDMKKGAVLTAAHCFTTQPPTHVYFGHNVAKTPICSNAPDHDAGVRISGVRRLSSGRIEGADIAIAFFERTTPPGYRNFYLDLMVQNTASIPDPELLKVLQKGLIKRTEMRELVSENADKLARTLGIDVGAILYDLVARHQYNAIMELLTPKTLPVAVAAVGFGATATTADRGSSGCKGWAHFVGDFDLCDDGGVGTCVSGREFVLREREDEGGSDTCLGDSGGPVFLETKDASGRYVRYLVGITSRAVKPDAETQCGGVEGGIYSLVARTEVINFVRSELAKQGMEANIAPFAPSPTAPSLAPTNGR